MEYSRRQFGKTVLASVPAYAAFAQTVGGVHIGVCTYSFREVPRDNQHPLGPIISALKECQTNICELFSPQLEPENSALAGLMKEANTPGPDGKVPSQQAMMAKYHAMSKGPEAQKYQDTVRQWRLNTPMSYFQGVRKQFDQAGVEIFAYTLNFNDQFSDDELDHCFQQAKALRAKAIAASTQVSMLPRLKPLAEKHKMYVAVHGHSDTKHPNEFSSPETFQKALDTSDWFRVNLDIGHFSAAGFDPMAYINEHHDRITHLHIKDRKKNDGPNEPFGQGDTPIKQVLALLKEKRYAIPALVEYEYHGTGTPVEEVKKCLAYMKSSLTEAS